MSTPKQVHDMDQAVAGMRTMAGAVAVAYGEMVEGGVPPDHAAMICAAWVSSMARPREGPDAP